MMHTKKRKFSQVILGAVAVVGIIAALVLVLPPVLTAVDRSLMERDLEKVANLGEFEVRFSFPLRDPGIFACSVNGEKRVEINYPMLRWIERQTKTNTTESSVPPPRYRATRVVDGLFVVELAKSS